MPGGGGRAQPPLPPALGRVRKLGLPLSLTPARCSAFKAERGRRRGGRKGGKCCNVAPGGRAKEAANPPPGPGASPRAEPTASSGRAADSPPVSARCGEGGTDATPAGGTAARSGRKGGGAAQHPPFTTLSVVDNLGSTALCSDMSGGRGGGGALPARAGQARTEAAAAAAVRAPAPPLRSKLPRPAAARRLGWAMPRGAFLLRLPPPPSSSSSSSSS